MSVWDAPEVSSLHVGPCEQRMSLDLIDDSGSKLCLLQVRENVFKDSKERVILEQVGNYIRQITQLYHHADGKNNAGK